MKWVIKMITKQKNGEDFPVITLTNGAYMKCLEYYFPDEATLVEDLHTCFPHQKGPCELSYLPQALPKEYIDDNVCFKVEFINRYGNTNTYLCKIVHGFIFVNVSRHSTIQIISN